MNSRHARNLRAIYKDPVPASIEWHAIESLLLAVGCRLIEGTGARVRFAYRGVVAAFHRPHPANEAARYQVRATREFLVKIGVTPGESP